SAGVAQWDFRYLAVTQEFILAASRSETLHELLAARTPLVTSGLPAIGAFQAARSTYPEKLNAVNYFDFARLDWLALKDRWVEESKKVSAASHASGSQKSATSKVPDLLTNVNPQVFPRHLHFMAGASWKDAKGI